MKLRINLKGIVGIIYENKYVEKIVENRWHYKIVNTMKTANSMKNR